MNRPLTRLAVAVVATIGVMLPAGVAGAHADTAAVRAAPPSAPHIGCRLERPDATPAVRCRWTTVDSRRVASYVVYRAQLRPEQTGREPIARLAEGQRPTVLDADVRRRTVMAYAVVAVDRNGAPLAVSNIVRVKIPSGF